MSSHIEKFKANMNRNDFQPPKDIKTDGQYHEYAINGPPGGSRCWYVLNINKPGIGLYGFVDSDDYYEWHIKAQGPNARVNKKVKKMLDLKPVSKEKNDEMWPDTDIQAKPSKTIEGARDIDDEVVTRLSVLSPFDYDRVRKEEAQRLNIRVSTLDKEVLGMRKLALIAKSIGPRLLSDIREVFEKIDTDRLRTMDIISALCTDKNSRWTIFNRGSQISPKQIAYLLKQYAIESQDFRFPTGVFKGYTQADISAAYSALKAMPVSQSRQNYSPVEH